MKNIRTAHANFNGSRHLTVLTLLIINLLYSFCTAIASEPAFSRLTMADGLSHYSVMATYQDERGLLWIGTRGGLDVYDGTHIRNFRKIPGDKFSPMSNYVRAITGDRAGHVYVLTIPGICIYDLSADRFTNVPVRQATAMAYGSGRLFYAFGRRIATLTPDGKSTEIDIKGVGSEVSVLSVVDSALYIGMVDGGLIRHDLHDGKSKTVLPHGNITCVFADYDGKIWVGTHADGLYMIDPSGHIQQFRHNAGNPASVCSNFIRSVCRDNRGRLWVGTFEGLSCYSGRGAHFDNYLTGAYAPESTTAERLSHSSVWSLTCDLQGTVWVGTYFNGLLYYNPENDIFNTYRADNSPGMSLSYPVTGEMAEDNYGKVWIATEGGGLNRLDPLTGAIDWHMHSGSDYNNIKALKYDAHRRCLWVGTHLGGLKKYNPTTGEYTVFPLGNDKANIVCDIEMYDQNTLLLATHDGIYRFDIPSGAFSPLFRTGSEGHVISLALDIVLDHARTLWIGGAEGGLYSYNFNTRRMKLYRHDDALPHSLGSNGINFLYVSPSNDIWIGTSEVGLDRFDREREQFIHYTHAEGSLPSDCVFGARQLPDGRLLVLTDKALALLDGEQTTSYSIGRAVPLSAFNNKAIHLSADGTMAYAGGIDGLVTFSPNDLKPRETRYSVFPVRLFVDGREIAPADNSGILPTALSATKSLTLNGAHNFFTLKYAITDFTHDSNLVPQYRLEGYSDDWLPMPADRQVSFTNLDPGDYRLHVRGSSDPDAPEHILEVSVLPPFYLHWTLIVAYVLAALGLGWWSVSIYRRRVAMHQAIALERQRSNDMEELNQNKLRFFVNISNEFRTPLALIMGKMESLMRSPQMPHALLNKVNGAYTNCVLMRDMMAELLDFRRYEQGAMNIKVGEHNVVKFLAEIHALFRDYAADKDIRFRFNRSNESLMLWYDPAQLRKVVNNLLSNAFKHTEAGGEVTLSVRRGDGTVVIEVSDTGCGIPAEDIDKIFNRFYQGNTDVDGDWQGVGVGLALAKGIVELHHGKIEAFSTPGQSASFVVTLPTGRDHFADDQIAGSGDYRQAKEYNVQHTRPMLPVEIPAVQPEEPEPMRDDVMVIAEGNVQLRDMLTDIFRPYFHILSTGDGTEAMNMIEENSPRLIVSGYSLPGISGVKLCRKVKSQSATADTPYVFVSSHSADHEILEALNAGADDYLTLPFDVRQLLARCRNLVSKHQKRADNKVPVSAHPDDTTDSMFASNGADIAFMRRAVEVVEANLADGDFNIDRFAAAMNVSRTSLFLRIKTVSGQTPNDFVVAIKMKHAMKMLSEQPETNISDIAYALGFSSPRYFSRCFKERFHQSPRAYRAGHGGV